MILPFKLHRVVVCSASSHRKSDITKGRGTSPYSFEILAAAVHTAGKRDCRTGRNELSHRLSGHPFRGAEHKQKNSATGPLARWGAQAQSQPLDSGGLAPSIRCIHRFGGVIIQQSENTGNRCLISIRWIWSCRATITYIPGDMGRGKHRVPSMLTRSAGPRCIISPALTGWIGQAAISKTALNFKSITVTGEIYDAFDLIKTDGKTSKLISRIPRE